jgi:short-subunit dehydrogenase
VSGTGRDSLGASLITGLSERTRDIPLIAVDLSPEPTLYQLDNVHVADIDLNPLSHRFGFPGFVEECRSKLLSAQSAAVSPGISTLVSSAGVYEFGPFASMSTEARGRVMGVNTCGKLELLHAVLSLNAQRGINNASEFTLIDIGSSHALDASAGRALYASTKAMSLDLCIAMNEGKEAARIIYIAPGPIDTHMLHRNHWVSKGQGPEEFIAHVRALPPDRYRAIFQMCDEDAFEEAASSSGLHSNQLRAIFRRYKDRRMEQENAESGIIQPNDLANRLVEIAIDADAYPSGLYFIQSPGGKLQMDRMEFAALKRRP